MCLITKQQAPLIASEDMIVYKAAIQIKPNLVSSYFRGFYYILGELVVAKIGEKAGVNKDLILEGLHSFLSINALLDYMAPSYENFDRYIFEATIPKGAEYYIGDKGDVVSNQLIINK